MKTFKQYLAESLKSYYFVVKLTVKPTDEHLQTIETILKKYDLLDMSSPTELVGDKYDFMDTPYRAIYAVTCQLGSPVSNYILMNELRFALNINEKFIVVRTSNEPIELYSEDLEFKREADIEAANDGFTSRARLDTDQFYDNVEQPLVKDVYGDAYNKKFLDYLANIKANRPTMDRQESSPLFTWIQMKEVEPLEPKQDLSDFNKQFNGPKPITKSKGDIIANPIDPSNLGTYSNFDDRVTQNYRLYKNDKGKKVDIKSRRATIKSGKA